MKSVLVSMIKNESDILETFIRYHLKLVDRIIVVNHRSFDASAKIVRKLVAEGLPVELQEEERVGHVQSSVMTRLMKESVNRWGADWVIPLDADEFLVPTVDGDMRRTLAMADRSCAIRVPWRNYIPHVEDDWSEPMVPRRITRRLQTEIKQRYKVIVPAALAVNPDVVLRQGNHGLIWASTGRRVKEVVESDRLALAHFPVRSAEQITAKAFGGWLSVLAKPDRKEDETSHWKVLFDRFKRGRNLSRAELTDIAIGYLDAPGENEVRLVVDPIPLAENLQLLYSGDSGCDPSCILAQTAEDIISDLVSRCREDRDNRNFWQRLVSNNTRK